MTCQKINAVVRCFIILAVITLSLGHIAAFAGSAGGGVCSPPAMRTWIRISDARGQYDSLWFGFDPAATCSVETALCEYDVWELCGPPTDLACYLWFVHDCNSDSPVGMWVHDYRSINPPERIDSFYLNIVGDPPFSLNWLSAGMRGIADSVTMCFYWRPESVLVRMDRAESLVHTPNYGRRSQGFIIRTYRGGATAVVETVPACPGRFSLEQNYPNPFNPSTAVTFTIAREGVVHVNIYDLLGRDVADIVNERLAPGVYTRSWDASGVPSGVYFLRLRADGFVDTKAISFIR